VIILGLLCLIAGYLIGLGILVTVGWILLVIGVLLLVLGMAGHPVGGRTWY
jgi:hypothetical protein